MIEILLLIFYILHTFLIGRLFKADQVSGKSLYLFKDFSKSSDITKEDNYYEMILSDEDPLFCCFYHIFAAV